MVRRAAPVRPATAHPHRDRDGHGDRRRGVAAALVDAPARQARGTGIGRATRRRGRRLRRAGSARARAGPRHRERRARRWPDRAGELLEARLAELAQVALEHQRRHEHQQEARERQPEGCRQGDHQEHSPGDEPDHRPLHAADGVGVQRGLADLASEGRVVLVEPLCDLLEDAFLVLGKRHVNPLSPGRPNRHAQVFHRVRRTTTRVGKGNSQFPGISPDLWSSGPHCSSPRLLTRSPRRPTDDAGPIASSPNRSRIASMAPLASSQAGPSDVVEAELAGPGLDEPADGDAQQPHAGCGVDLAQQLAGRGDERRRRRRPAPAGSPSG